MSGQRLVVLFCFFVLPRWVNDPNMLPPLLSNPVLLRSLLHELGAVFFPNLCFEATERPPLARGPVFLLSLRLSSPTTHDHATKLQFSPLPPLPPPVLSLCIDQLWLNTRHINCTVYTPLASHFLALSGFDVAAPGKGPMFRVPLTALIPTRPEYLTVPKGGLTAQLVGPQDGGSGYGPGKVCCCCQSRCF